jgi:hypothetical protein
MALLLKLTVRGMAPFNSTEKGGTGQTTEVDFRKLNEKTTGDAHLLPDITEILDQLGQSKYFTCLDMVMGYHQIELEPREGSKTAFSTEKGHWEYLRLPFGLKTAPATFQKDDELRVEWTDGYTLFCVPG